MVPACCAFAAALYHRRILLPPTPPLLLPHMAGDPSTVMEGGASPELAFRKICEGAVSADDTFPVPGNAANLVHPCAVEEPDAAPAAGTPELFASPGGPGGGQLHRRQRRKRCVR